jgi:hypothetical protein
MKTIKSIKTLSVFLSSLFVIGTLSAQVKLDANNYLRVGYQQYTPILFGSNPQNGVDYGEWWLELFDNGIQFSKPFPTQNWGNYNFYIANSTGNVGIGKKPTYKLDVNGDIATYGTLRISSDARLKTNIVGLNDCLTKLNKLNGKSYNKIRPELKTELDKITDPVKYKTVLESNKRNGTESDKGTEFGFLAQELAIIFPELTRADSSGYLTVDYIGLIPVIVEALKSQQNIITSQDQNITNLQKQIADIKKNCCVSQAKSATLDETKNNVTPSTNVTLYQNTPNPFTQTTEIKYYLPETIASASLLIFNMQGTQLKTITIPNRRNGSVIINGSELTAGMYLYTLVADGQEIDTKRMILTQ